MGGRTCRERMRNANAKRMRGRRNSIRNTWAGMNVRKGAEIAMKKDEIVVAIGEMIVIGETKVVNVRKIAIVETETEIETASGHDLGHDLIAKRKRKTNRLVTATVDVQRVVVKTAPVPKTRKRRIRKVKGKSA